MDESAQSGSLRRESAEPVGSHGLATRLSAAAADLRNIPRYAVRALVAVAFVCGLLSLWGLRGDGPMPSMSSLSGLDPYRISSARCVAVETDAQARWNGLAPALAILDRVNPTVATWLREKHRRGLVVFRNQYDAAVALAKYDQLGGRVVIERELFCENDGTIAVTLCHEYRHSRQNLGKFCQYVLSFLFVRGGDLSIIENDAVVYEHEAHNAIFGNGESRASELAAWQAAVGLQDRRSRPEPSLPLSSSLVLKSNRLP
jgi:hypothetical protein